MEQVREEKRTLVMGHGVLTGGSTANRVIELGVLPRCVFLPQPQTRRTAHVAP